MMVLPQDRGTLKPGMRADVNIIDWEKLKMETPHIASDLPTGAKHWLQKAED